MKKLAYPLLLLTLNLGTILATEFFGGGTWFYDTGLIHFIAIAYCLVSIYVILRLRFLEGEVFFKIFERFLAALILFNLVHIVGFIGHTLGQNTFESLGFLTVMTLYGMGLVQIYRGFTSVLQLRSAEKRVPFTIPGVVLFLLIATTSLVISLEGADKYEIPLLVAFALFNIPLAILLIVKSIKIAEHIPILKPFSRYIRFSIVLFVFAAWFEFVTSVPSAAVSEAQRTYLAHFAFYAGISLQLLAFSTLFNLGGIYKDLPKITSSKKSGE